MNNSLSYNRYYWDYNSYIHLVFILLTILAFLKLGWLGLLVYPLLHLLSDVLYYGFSVPIFDPSTTIRRGYNLSTILNDASHAQGLDYGFNFYNGNYEKSREQAQIDKFDYAYQQLKLKPGMSVIDIGCGCGDWLNYLQKKGIECVGVNITQEQVKICHDRGLKVYCVDWKKIPTDDELKKQLYQQFDRVTFWDTVEHFVPMTLLLKIDKKNAVYTRMFAFARELLKDNNGMIFISCLHMRKNFFSMKFEFSLLKKMAYTYILDKFHSGTYPSGPRDTLVNTASEYFDLVERKDVTYDYYMTSVLEKEHFGRHKFSWTIEKVAYSLWSVICDPFWFHRFVVHERNVDVSI